MKSLMIALALTLSCSFAAMAAEPSIDAVYQQAQSGHLETALNEMAGVVQNHPNSAKAHYVYADLLAKSGQYDRAREELNKAEGLAPGLPFVTRPGAVAELQQVIANRSQAVAQPGQARHEAGTPWGMIFLVGGLALLLVIWLARRQAQLNTVMMPPQGGPGYYPPGSPMAGQPYPYYPGGGGMGSGLMGSLATGAALGAGMVAGEALASRLMDGGHAANPGVIPTEGTNDMGGQDFGIGDSSSWDSGGGGDIGGGGDWS
jgi:hypothetical protein